MAEGRPSIADRRCLRCRSRGRPGWCGRAGWVWWLTAASTARGLVLLPACLATSERAPLSPLAFPIEHSANCLTTGGAAVARLAAPRLPGRFIAPGPVAEGPRRNNFCCVTTRRRNFRSPGWLGRKGGTPSARTLGGSMLGFDRFIGTPLRLTLGRLPAAHGTQAFGILAVALVPTSRLELLSTAFPEAHPRPWSSATAVCLMLTVAHGSLLSQGTARGERANDLPGRFSTVPVGGHCQIYFAEETRQGRKPLEKGAAKKTTINQTVKETV